MMRTTRPAIAAIQHDRGDADPVMTIVAALLSVIVAAMIGGILVLVITTANGFLTEQSRATSATIAQRSWSDDARNASLVRAFGQNSVHFYEIVGAEAGLNLDRGSSATLQCRQSVWTVDQTAGTLQNEIRLFGEQFCDLNPDLPGYPQLNNPPPPDTSTTGVRLDGLSDVEITAINKAGRDLRFNDLGAETGLHLESPNASINSRNSWWTELEWQSAMPSAINPDARLEMPIAGERPLQLTGTTGLYASANRGVPSGLTEADPDITQFDPPKIVELTAARSGVTGRTDFIEREGAAVTVALAATAPCGPFTAEYQVTMTPLTAGAVSRTATVYSGEPAAVLDLDRVPNGSRWRVDATVACPEGTSSAPQTATITWTQDIPAPVLQPVTVTSAPTAIPARHRLTWNGVSSLPTSYRLQVAHDAGAWADAVTIGRPAASVTGTATADAYPNPAGGAYEHRYQVIPSVDGAVGPASNVVSATGPTWGSITPTGVRWSNGDATRAYPNLVLWNPVNCWAGGTAQYRVLIAGSYSGWVTATQHTRTLAYGTTYVATVTARCGSTAPESPDLHQRQRPQTCPRLSSRCICPRPPQSASCSLGR